MRCSHRGYCWVLHLLILVVAVQIGCLQGAMGAEGDSPVDVPDEVGLGERLALIAWLNEHHIAVADPADLPALRRSYLARAHPDQVPSSTATTADQRRGDLAAELYRKFGQNPPQGASSEDIQAIITRLEHLDDESVAQDQAVALADDAHRTDGRRSPAAGPGPSTAPQTHTGLLAAPASAQPSAAAVPVLWPTTPAPRDGDARLAEAIAGIQASEHLPALAVAVVRSTGMEAAAVVGWRKLGDPTPATLSDCWHMGSDTKAMTASLAALLVERGQVQWDTTLGDVVPQTPSQWRSVTLNHLLTHRAGLPRNEEWKMTTTRMGMLELMAKLQPATAPGAKYSYSNLGYALVGLMMERITGVTWEAFIDKELWQPLGITGAGFGGMGTTGLVDGPWSHKLGGIVAGNGPLLDFPPCAGPAARVHISLLDWSRFIADHLRGARGMPGLLRPESYAHLHQPVPGSNYACGWMVDQRPWAKGTVLHHDGTNKVNFSVVWVAPAIDLAILVCCNEGDAGGACDAAVSAILKLLHL